jgi:ABC-type Fe3+/spermidine/putrescine transport system ATPase subunit
MSQLILQNLTKSFRGVPAVQDLWLDIQSGEIVSLLGPSGCGKSTTLQLIAGIRSPDAGVIELNGKILNQVPPEKRDIALVLQRGLLFPHLTVGENVAFGLKMRGVNRVEREQQARGMLQQVQLEGFADRRPSELSGGQAQRVALARSLVIRPKLLLLDEPLSALDANLREEMQSLILQLHAQTGVPLMLVTHDQSEAVVMSDRIALMFEGRLRQVATPEQLYRQPCDELTARFMGGVNFFTATAQDHQWKITKDVILTSHTSAQGQIQFTIRPEQIQLFPEPCSAVNLIPAIVVDNRFTGMQRRLTLQRSSDRTLDHSLDRPADRSFDDSFQAWIAPTQNFAIGQTVWAYLPPDALWCFSQSALETEPMHVL